MHTSIQLYKVGSGLNNNVYFLQLHKEVYLNNRLR